MWNYKRSARFSLYVTYLFIFLLVIATLSLPWLVTWYVETKGKSPDLPTIIMLTCYPCVPFAAVALLSLQRVLKNLLNGKIIIMQNVNLLRRVSWCCLIAALVMLIAGGFYLPFYIASAAAAFCALITRVIKNLLHCWIAQQTGNK